MNARKVESHSLTGPSSRGFLWARFWASSFLTTPHSLPSPSVVTARRVECAIPHSPPHFKDLWLFSPAIFCCVLAWLAFSHTKGCPTNSLIPIGLTQPTKLDEEPHPCGCHHGHCHFWVHVSRPTNAERSCIISGVRMTTPYHKANTNRDLVLTPPR